MELWEQLRNATYNLGLSYRLKYVRAEVCIKVRWTVWVGSTHIRTVTYTACEGDKHLFTSHITYA